MKVHPISAALIAPLYFLAQIASAEDAHRPTTPPAKASSAADSLANSETDDANIHAKYEAWKATLSPERKNWEEMLQANLGEVNRKIYERQRLKGQVTGYEYVEDDPKLPRVLLIGDSISIGYTPFVRQALSGKANVHRAPENCGSTTIGVKKLEVWLADKKWKVIHFNFGLHDLVTPPGQYEANLEQIISRLKSTNAKLIWANTTPVPPDSAEGPAAPQAVIELNTIAATIMQRRYIATEDLFAFISPHVAQTQVPKDIHFQQAGYNLLGRQVATSIEASLNQQPTKRQFIISVRPP